MDPIEITFKNKKMTIQKILSILIFVINKYISIITKMKKEKRKMHISKTQGGLALSTVASQPMENR